MQRLLVGKSWYQPLQPNSIADNEYESVLLDNAEEILEGFIAVPFRLRVSTERGDSFPHLALIDQKYRQWWLVLLETGPAPNVGFISKQVEILLDGLYGADVARILCERDTRLSFPKVERLLNNEPPRVHALLAHPPAPSFDHPSVCIGILEIFRSILGTNILRVNGKQPRPPSEDLIATCSRNPHMRNMLKLKLVDFIALGDNLQIEFLERQTNWAVASAGDDMYLIPEPGVRLPVGQTLFTLLRSEAGALRLTASMEVE